MKKLLVLSLVLGVASLATAGLSIVNTAPNAAVISSDTNAAYNLYIAAEKTITVQIDALPAAGGLAAVGSLDDYGDAYLWSYSTAAGAPGSETAAGDHFTVTLLSGDGGLVEIWNEAFDTKLGEVTLVPEPATMALLGLGALVLRRKK